MRGGGANFRCSLERLSWPAAFLRGQGRDKDFKFVRCNQFRLGDGVVIE